MCEALGKSSKDPVLAFREVRLERQLGGSLAIARHCAGLGAQVTLGTALGPEPETAGLVTQELASRVALKLHVQEARPTITKRRFVDESSMQRVFETYQMAAETLVADYALDSHVAKLLKEPFDVVLVCDYGHGFFSEALIHDLAVSRQTLAINTQANAGNRGFNTIGKYSWADFVCLNGGELALELRRKHAKVEELVPEIQGRLSTKSLLITEGARGLLICPEKAQPIRVPAFAPFVRDRVGAGDALFAVTSLTQALGAAPQITGFWGNLAGATAVAQLGNHDAVSHADLAKHAISILK
jgi:bifunctional ADP-heptose synthase (sugar kinase/adenylyltransferase)